MKGTKILTLLSAILLIVVFVSSCANEKSKAGPHRLEILFLGHENNQNHDSELLASTLLKEYFRSGINISFTTDLDDLNKDNLSKYDGLIVYANHDNIGQSQEEALLGFVKGGKGLIALHSASFCFRNSDEIVEMIGGQFKSHEYDTIQTTILDSQHPVMEGIPSFSTLDETYVHDKLSPNIEVLTERIEGEHHEPYTWVRPYGKGRVFYTAYGHDKNTFETQGFLDLVENGILWAIGDEAKSRLEQLKLPSPSYSNGMVPNYEKRSPAPLVQEALSPEESMALMQVPVDFDIQLFASEPMIVNPIYINWDEKGRLWVIETVNYPNEVKTDDIGDDKIKILEDTDGDGKADKVTVFADKLNIPTSFIFSNDGIIVSQSPSFLFLKDTDGDDVADVRQEVLSGWGKNDTHAQSSNLRYGLDNKIWGVVGYSGFNGIADGDSTRFGNSVYKFDPNSFNLEFLSNTSNNTWGLGFSEEFDVFISTANNTHTAFFGMPNKYFKQAGIDQSGVQKLDAHYNMHVAIENLRQVDVMGGFTAAAGHSLYTARDFPKSYWNRVGLVTEPTGRLVHKVILKQDGAGFIEDGDGWNLFTSADEWAAPIQAEVGPDGAVWITDWYNFIIQHNPTPSVASSGVDAVNGKGNAYVNPLRDRSKGRIYRISYKDSDKRNKLKLSKDNTKDLVKALSNDNMFWRTTAQRLLVEKKDKSIFKDLYKLVKDQSVDEIGINAPAIHALWTLHGLDAFDGTNSEALKIASIALTHPAAGVRRAAVQVLPKTSASYAAMSDAQLFDDQDFRVRLAAVLATTEMPTDDLIANTLVNMAEKNENFDDMWLNYALIIASKHNEQGFKAEFAKRGFNINPSLMNASLAQRLAFGSRLNAISNRAMFGRRSRNLNPDMINSEFVISGNMEYRPRGSDDPSIANYTGMIMAQGDRRNGYGVYFLNDKLHFTINKNGRAYNVTSKGTLPMKFSFKAGFQADGQMSLLIDDNIIGTVQLPGLLDKKLTLPLRSVREIRNGSEKIANYPDTFFLSRSNRLTDAQIEILSPIMVENEAMTNDNDIVLNVLKDKMKYDKELITAVAGTTIKLTLNNPDFMQHNLVLIKPNTSEQVGKAADELATDSDGASFDYVPQMPEVIASTPLINSGGSYTLIIDLPDTPGDYPYICTFPGHWRIMKGVLRVVKNPKQSM